MDKHMGRHTRYWYLGRLGNFSRFLSSKLIFSKKIFQGHYQIVKQVGSRSSPVFYQSSFGLKLFADDSYQDKKSQNTWQNSKQNWPWQFDLGLCCISKPFWQVISNVQNFRMRLAGALLSIFHRSYRP